LATILYNKSSDVLASADSVVAHIGYDGWWMQDTVSVQMTPVDDFSDLTCLTKSEIEKGEWYKADVRVWNTAATLDFAFSDDDRQLWDNMGGSDYHSRVQNAAKSM